MTLGERIKKVRRLLDLTQQEFANRFGSTQNVLANYESGRRNPSSAALNNISKTFNVSETWLRTGEGEMFVPAPTSELDALAAKYPNMTHETYVFVEKLVNLPKVNQDIIMGFLRKVVAGFGDAVPGTLAKAPQEMTSEELHAELDRQLEEEKEATAKSEAL